MRPKDNPPPKPLTLEGIEKIADPAEQAQAAAAFMAYAEYRRSQGMAIRDAAIRRLRASGKTIPQVVAETKTSLGTVKAILR